VRISRLIGINFEVRPYLPSGEEDFCFGGERKGNDLLYMGRVAEQKDYDRAVYFDISGARVVAILGKRGSGKSYTLGALAESISSNSGQISSLQQKHAVLLLDTLNIFWTMIYEPSTKMLHESIRNQLDGLEKWDLKPEKLSNVEVYIPAGFRTRSTPSVAKEFYISVAEISPSDWSFLLRIDLFRDPMGQLLNLAYEKVTLDGWQEGGKKTSPKKVYSVDDLIQCILKDDELTSKRFGFHVNVRRALASKLRSIRAYDMFASEGTEISLMVRPGITSILLLADLPTDLRCVVASVLFRKVLEFRREYSLTRKREIVGDLPAKLAESIGSVWVMIDEAQNIVPAEEYAISTPSLVELVRVGRNFGISVAITTQQPSAIDQRLMAQVDTLIAHKLTVRSDIDKIVSNEKTSPPQSIRYSTRDLDLQDVLRTLPIGYAIVSNDASPRDFIVQFRERVTVHGGFEV